MASDQFIVGIDIGASKLCVAAAVRERTGAVRYIGHGSVPSAGLLGGEVVDPGALSSAFSRAVEEARMLLGTPVHDVVISVSGAQIEALDRAGGIDLGGSRPINQAEVMRAITQSRGSDPHGLATIHRVVRSLSLDGTILDDPTGRIGRRLEVVTRDYAAPAHLIERLRRAADAVGVKIHTLLPEAVASAAAVSSDEERAAGVAIVDIGSATTDIAVYLDRDLCHIAGIPIGGHHITSDLANVLEISVEEAEQLKRRHGAIGQDRNEELFEWNPRSIAALQRLARIGEVPGAAVRSISAARVIQIFDRVREALSEVGAMSQLRAGVVLTGGASQLDGVRDIAEAILRVPVRTGAALAGDGFPSIADPAVSASVGLARYCATRAAPPVHRAEQTGVRASGIIHPLMVKRLASADTIDVIPERRAGAAVRRRWGDVIRDWMREFIPARGED